MHSRYFPIRFFRWFVTRQILFSILLFAALYFCFFLLLEWGVTPHHTLLIAGLTSLLAVILISLVMGRVLSGPLGRLVEKTRRMRKFPFEEENLQVPEPQEDEPGEWYDLERALNKLGYDLRHKTIRLSREKTELRTIMGAVTEAIFAIDQEQRPLFFNSQLALLFATPKAGTDQNWYMTDLIRSPEILQAYNRCLKQGMTERLDVTLTPPGAAAAHTFQLSIAPLRKKHNDEIYGAVGLFSDVTDLKKAEKIRIEFVANVSHELRTPLTSIKGYLQTLDDDFQKGRLDQAGEFISVVQKNVDRLMLLVNDLLDLSSLESGAALSQVTLDARELTEAVMKQLPMQDHQVRMHYGKAEFQADGVRVEQVLRNLLQNAARYVPKGGQIEIFWESLGGSGCRLRVKDNGPGITLQHQARLFERFYRIDEARSREVGGTGIGLSIVKHIMQRHGGSVKVVSEPGHGAEFICDFP